MQRQEKNVSRIIVNSSIWSLDFALACHGIVAYFAKTNFCCTATPYCNYYDNTDRPTK